MMANVLLLMVCLFLLTTALMPPVRAEDVARFAAAPVSLGHDDDDFKDGFTGRFTTFPPCPSAADAWTSCGYSSNGRWARLSWAWVSDLEPGLAALNRGQLLLTVPGNGEKRGAQIISVRDDYWYGTYRARIKAGSHSGAAGQGSVNAFFFYDYDTEGEIDVEILTKDNSAREVNFVTHPGGYGTTCRLPADPSTTFIEYGFDWYADKIVYFVNGKACGQETRGVPDEPGTIMLNHWTGNVWAGDAPPLASVMRVDYVSHSSFIDVTRPANRGVVWPRGAARTISWKRFGEVAAAPVTIELWKADSFFRTIATDVSNRGVYRWNIPMLLPTGSDYSIRISSALNDDYYDFSRFDFTLK